MDGLNYGTYYFFRSLAKENPELHGLLQGLTRGIDWLGNVGVLAAVGGVRTLPRAYPGDWFQPALPARGVSDRGTCGLGAGLILRAAELAGGTRRRPAWVMMRDRRIWVLWVP